MRKMRQTLNPSTGKENAYWGQFGGRFVTERFLPALMEVEHAMGTIATSKRFARKLSALHATVVGRPTPIFEAKKFAHAVDPGGTNVASLWLKREDLCRNGAAMTGAMGQALLARMMGKRRIITAVGGAQHGIATAAAAAIVGLECQIYQGARDRDRHVSETLQMQQSARVVTVDAGSRSLKDAMSEALRDWATSFPSTYLCFEGAIGPRPFPRLISMLQKVVGEEAYEHFASIGAPPDAVIACVGAGAGGSGIFDAFVQRDPTVALYGVECGGDGGRSGRHAAPLTYGRPGVLHGARTYVLCDDNGQIEKSYSIISGLDYPGAGPALAYLRHTGKMVCVTPTDQAALAAAECMRETEGIFIQMEAALALAAVAEVAAREASRRAHAVRLLVCTSGGASPGAYVDWS